MAAGFDFAVLPEPWTGDQPLDEFLVSGKTVPLTPRQLAPLNSVVLRDPAGRIVATWDEGRWWTPSESSEFLRRLREGDAALPALVQHPNRSERRRRRKRGGA